MNPGNPPPQSRPEQGPPPTDKGKMALAGVLLVDPDRRAPLGAAATPRSSPKLFGFPFFFWYQFLWVFICSALTWTAYKLTLSARGKTTHKVGEDR